MFSTVAHAWVNREIHLKCVVCYWRRGKKTITRNNGCDSIARDRKTTERKMGWNGDRLCPGTRQEKIDTAHLERRHEYAGTTPTDYSNESKWKNKIVNCKLKSICIIIVYISDATMQCMLHSLASTVYFILIRLMYLHCASNMKELEKKRASSRYAIVCHRIHSHFKFYSLNFSSAVLFLSFRRFAGRMRWAKKKNKF